MIGSHLYNSHCEAMQRPRADCTCSPVYQARPFDAIKAAIHADPEYAWSWQCNLAVPIMDVAGASHKDANRSAALIMAQMFDYDITAHSAYEWGKSMQQTYFEARVASEREEDARPTFEGDEAEVWKEIADIAAMTYEGHWSHKALALLNAKDVKIARLYANAKANNALARHEANGRKEAVRDGACLADCLEAERDEALARAEQAEAELATERTRREEGFKVDEEIMDQYKADLERAEKALADRDAAIVEACRRAQCSVAYAPAGTSFREWWAEPLRPFLPAPEPVDPLVEAVQ